MQAIGLPHWPVGLHVCTPLFEHRVAPGPHATHAEFRQTAPPVHVIPQPPQLPLTVSSTHVPPQTPRPAWLHACPHAVPLQLAVPPLGAGQSEQLGPQAFTSLATHEPAQGWVPPVHWHALLTQCSPPEQPCPQVPQLVSSLVSSTHALLQLA